MEQQNYSLIPGLVGETGEKVTSSVPVLQFLCCCCSVASPSPSVMQLLIRGIWFQFWQDWAVLSLIQVICAKCSEFKPLADNSRHNRVCKDCFHLLSATPCNLGNEAAGEQKKKNSTEVYLFCQSASLISATSAKAWLKSACILISCLLTFLYLIIY